MKVQPLTVVLAIATAGVFDGFVTHARVRPVRTELTAVSVARAFDASGKDTGRTVRTIAVRADGAKAIHTRSFSYTSQGSEPTETRDIFDVTARQHTQLRPQDRTRVTEALAPVAVARLLRPTSTACVEHPGEPEPSTRESLLGYDVVKHTAHVKVRDASLVVEDWLAPRLDCLSLKRTLTLTDAGGAVIAREQETVIEVHTGRPDRSHFNVPSGYRQVRLQPSSLHDLAMLTQRR